MAEWFELTVDRHARERRKSMSIYYVDMTRRDARINTQCITRYMYIHIRSFNEAKVKNNYDVSQLLKEIHGGSPLL